MTTQNDSVPSGAGSDDSFDRGAVCDLLAELERPPPAPSQPRPSASLDPGATRGRPRAKAAGLWVAGLAMVAASLVYGDSARTKGTPAPPAAVSPQLAVSPVGPAPAAGPREGTVAVQPARALPRLAARERRPAIVLPRAPPTVAPDRAAARDDAPSAAEAIGPPPVIAADPCARLPKGPRRMVCADPALAVADRELDAAYRAAGRAGVPPWRLVRENRRWREAVEEAAEFAPAEVPEIYAAGVAAVQDLAGPAP